MTFRLSSPPPSSHSTISADLTPPAQELFLGAAHALFLKEAQNLTPHTGAPLRSPVPIHPPSQLTHSELDRLSEIIGNLRRELSELGENNRSLQSELRENAQQRADLESRLSTLQQQHSENLNNQHPGMLQNLQTALSSREEMIGQLRNQLDETERQRASIQQQFESQASQLNLLGEQLSNTTQRCAILTNTMGSQRATIESEFQDRLEELRTQNAELQATVLKFAGEEFNTHTTMSHLQEEKTALQTTLEQSEARVRDAESRVAALGAESARLQTALGQSEARLHDAESRVATLRAENAKLQTDLEQNQSQLQQLEQRAATLESELKNERAALAQAQEQYRTLIASAPTQSQLEELRNEIAAKEHRIGEQSSWLSIANGTVVRIRAEREALKAKVADGEARFIAIEAELNTLQQRLDTDRAAFAKKEEENARALRDAGILNELNQASTELSLLMPSSSTSHGHLQEIQELRQQLRDNEGIINQFSAEIVRLTAQLTSSQEMLTSAQLAHSRGTPLELPMRELELLRKEKQFLEGKVSQFEQEAVGGAQLAQTISATNLAVLDLKMSMLSSHISLTPPPPPLAPPTPRPAHSHSSSNVSNGTTLQDELIGTISQMRRAKQKSWAREFVWPKLPSNVERWLKAETRKGDIFTLAGITTWTDNMLRDLTVCLTASKSFCEQIPELPEHVVLTKAQEMFNKAFHSTEQKNNTDIGSDEDWDEDYSTGDAQPSSDMMGSIFLPQDSSLSVYGSIAMPSMTSISSTMSFSGGIKGVTIPRAVLQKRFTDKIEQIDRSIAFVQHVLRQLPNMDKFGSLSSIYFKP